MSTETRDAKHIPLTQAEKLRQDADAARQVRALANHPDVIALRTEKVRNQVDVAIWVGILLGLAFTMVNVQSFAASGAPMWSLAWLSAWLLDPMVSLVLVAVLRAEQVTARYQVETGKWVHRTKWFAFVATYVMNTWQSWVHLHLAGIALHSVPPVLVFLAAETAPVLRDRLTEAVTRSALPEFTGQPADTTTSTADAPDTVTAACADDTTPTAQPARRKAPARRKPAPAAKPARKLLADYVTEARAAWAPGIEITPAWVRSVTDCSRGLSPKVADALAADTLTAPTALPVAADTAAVSAPEEEAA